MEKLQTSVAEHLSKQILPFWQKHTADLTQGGFFGHINDNNQPDPSAPKGLVMSARFLWSFSAFLEWKEDPVNRRLADHAASFLVSKLWDREHGGWFWFTDAGGQVEQRHKQVYGQAFALYAISQYLLVSGDYKPPSGIPGLRVLADQTWALLETHAKEKRYGGYWEACEEDWRPIPASALSDVDASCAKSMNTHLHLLEAYTAYHRLAPDSDGLKQAILDLVDIHFEKILDQDSGHLALYFNEDWSMLPGAISYGHDIEASWLVWEALEELGDKEKMGKLKPHILRLLDSSLEGYLARGNKAFLAHEAHGKKIDRSRIWWVQAETMVGLLNGWELSGQASYLEMMLAVWQGILEDQSCPSGDWYWKLGEDGKPEGGHPKAGAWKTPYHNGRACLELMKRSRRILDHEQTRRNR